LHIRLAVGLLAMTRITHISSRKSYGKKWCSAYARHWL